MLNGKQVESFVNSLNLHYKWTNPDQGANVIIVEGVIEYMPYSHKLKDLRDKKSYTSDTTSMFKKLCTELANSKQRRNLLNYEE